MRVDAEVALCSSSGWAHGCAAAGRKVVYLYTPARWLYQTQAYVGEDRGGLRRAAVAVLGGGLRAWDRRAAASADRWLTQSRATRERIQEAYGVDAEILPGPWTLDPGGLQEAPPGLRDRSPGFGLLVSRLLPYKNVAQAVEAMRALPERRLVVVGSGPERARLEALAPPGVELVGAVGDAGLRWLYARSAFLLAAAYEDYGLTPLEAAAFGRPSAVLRWGGFLDTVREGQTGVFFDRPEPGEIAAAVQRLLGRAWDSELIAAHAQRYSEERFIARLRAVVEEELGHVASPGQPAAVGEGQ
jgi:glycosyltransferase involved in cell wall biosynthesis